MRGIQAEVVPFTSTWEGGGKIEIGVTPLNVQRNHC